MGFFQDLKEDLSIAVDELTSEGMPEQADASLSEEQINSSLSAMSEAGKELAEKSGAAAVEETEQAAEQETAAAEEAPAADPEGDQDAMPSADLAKALEEAGVIEEEAPKDAISPDGKAAPSFGEQMQLDLNLASMVAEQPQTKADPLAAAANELKNIANIVSKEETDEKAEAEAQAAEEEKELQSPEEMMAETEEKKIEEETAAESTKAEPLSEADLEGEPVDENAVITRFMTVKGDVLSKGSIEIQGIVEGNVNALGKLNVSGNLKGDAKASEVFADAAQINGQINADGTVKIGKNSVIIGDIFASSAVIAGAVKGDIDVHGPVILDSTAIVMGNIKSKSVQINNGAAIEGMCSQCYADHSPSSFFEKISK